jgi:succinate dehydrogenase / fumarate reductase cytochrome b subunit
MNILLRVFTSTLGKKFLMAITGAGLFLFVVGHLVGNLQIFLGPDSINRYGHFLQTTPEILWPARIGLLAFVIIHIWASIALTIENRAARAQQYEVKELVRASRASRTMIWSGLIIAAFVCFHLAHYTLLTIHPEFRDLRDANGWHDIYRMMVLGFSNCCTGFFKLLGLRVLRVEHWPALHPPQPWNQRHVSIARVEKRSVCHSHRPFRQSCGSGDLSRLHFYSARGLGQGGEMT